MRVTAAVHAHKKRRKVLKQTKGYRGTRSKLWRVAREARNRAQRYSLRDRRQRKRQFRRLWITRINAAVRSHDLSYSRFMSGLKKAGIEVNRKMMADLAVKDAPGFARLVEMARAAS